MAYNYFATGRPRSSYQFFVVLSQPMFQIDRSSNIRRPVRTKKTIDKHTLEKEFSLNLFYPVNTMKPRRNRVKTNRAKTNRGYRKKSKTRKNRKRRRGGTCEDTNQRAFAYTTDFLYK